MDEDFARCLEAYPDAIMATDREGRITHVNAGCEALTGYTRDELLGRTPAMLKSGAHEADFYRRLWAALFAGEPVRAVFCNRRKDGELYYEDKIIRSHGDGFVAFGREVTAHAMQAEALAHAATHDSLTDLPNRRLFLDRLGQARRRAARHGEALTVAVMDIDRFRDTNTAFGHAGGDEVLQAVARRTQACLRKSDTVARIGGDEFALLLTGTGEDAAAPVLRKITTTNAVPVGFGGRTIPVGVSIGACSSPGGGASEAELLAQADRRMYQAKHAGGNRFVLSDKGIA